MFKNVLQKAFSNFGKLENHQSSDHFKRNDNDINIKTFVVKDVTRLHLFYRVSKLSIFILVLLVSLSVKAQVSTYSFAQTSGTYSAISGGTTLLAAATDDGASALTNIGFNFTYHGTLYTQFSASSNGYITLGAVADQYNYAPLSGTTSANAIAFMARDAMTGGAVTYLLTGTSPSRVLTIDFPAWDLTYMGTSDYVDAQIQLYETTNVIKIVYGTSARVSSFTGQVGMGGAANTDYNNRTSTTSWSATTAGTANTATMSWSTTAYPSSGQTYTWTPSSGCSGTPAPGNTLSAVTTACASVPFSLSLQNSTSGTGVTYQWQSSPDNITYTAISGSTLSTASVSQTAATYYRCVVTCTTNSGNSTPVLVGMSAPTACYCISQATNTGDDEIFNVTLGTLNNTSSCTTTGGTGSLINQYSNYTTGVTVPNLQQAGTYALSVTVGICGTSTWSGIVTAFIDFNQNGSFADAGELVYTSPYTLFAIAGTAVTANISIPAGATLGNTRMRVVETESTTAATSCGTYSYGETEDYTVNIITAPPCVAPNNQATSLSFTPSQFSVSGSFTAATSAPTGYLVIRTNTSTAPSAPVNATTYTVGASALGGVIVANGTSTTFVSTGLNIATTYWFWVYSYNAGCIGAPAYQVVSPLMASVTTTSCTLGGTKTVGPTGNYSTLTAAIAAINNSGLGGSVILELQSTYTSASETFPIVISSSIPCLSVTNTIIIRPQSGATGLSITSSNATGTINIDGGDYITIDGRPGGVGVSQLTIDNSSTTGYAIQLINGATNNTVKYCTISGVNNGTASGVVLLSNAVGLLTGNSYNTFTNCDFRDGLTTPTNLIYASGNTIDYTSQNIGNTITNSTFHDWFNASATVASAAINIVGGASDWTITSNSFYQTAARTFTMTTNTEQGAIFVTSSTGNNFTISNNYIGGSAANCGGTALTWSGGTTGTPTIRLIRFSTGLGATSTISGNTIANIAFTTSSTSTSHGLLHHQNGNVNITNNTIGSSTATNNITFTLASTSVSPFFYPLGFALGALASNINLNGNSIGGITVSTSSTGSISFRILYGQPVAGCVVTLNNNNVGGTVANSIQHTTINSTFGLLILNPAIGITITNNNIRNITHTSSASTASSLTGINVQASGGNHIITGNNIYNLSINSASVSISNTASIVGITMTGSAIGGTNVSNNNIYNLTNTNTAVAGWINGMYFATALAPQPQTIISRNFIHSINLSGASGAGMAGILFANTGNAMIYNNTIRLGVDIAGADITAPLQINGIYKAASASVGIYNNTIYIGGASVASGTVNTYAFRRASSGPADTVMNNIFYNARSNASGTGKHYAMSINAATTLVSNFNDALANGTGGVFGINSVTDYTTLASWQSANNQDWNSIAVDPQLTAPNGNAATINLHVNTAVSSALEQAGKNLPQVADDMDAQARASYTPTDIGADAGNFTVSDIAPPVVYFTPVLNTCATTDRSISGVVITDASGVPTTGTLVPRIYYKKGSGSYFSQPGSLTAGSGTNGTWSFTILSADMGGLIATDVVSYYIVAQDIATVPNIGSYAVGVIASNVNTITTAPTVPFTYNVNANSLAGTYNVGAGQTYTTITAAVAAYNTSCLSGPVVFQLMDASYSASETFPITINNNLFASAVNTLTIKPAAGVNVTITGLTTSAAIFKMLNARFVTIDGLKTGGSYLTLTSTNTTTACANIWLASSVSYGPGCKNISILNSRIIGGSGTLTTAFGIIAAVDGVSPAGSLAPDNDNITIQGDSVYNAYYGILCLGGSLVAGGANDNWVINNNIVGPAVNGTQNIGINGIYMANATNALISGNTVTNIGGAAFTLQAIGVNLAGNVNGVTLTQNNINNVIATASVSGTGAVAGLVLGANVINATVSRNTVSSIYNYSPSGYSSRGIIINTAQYNSNISIVNNMVSDIKASSDVSILYWPIGIDIEGVSGGVNVDFNTVNLSGTYAGYSSATGGTCILVNTSGGGLNVRNNILANTYINSSNLASKLYAIYSVATGAQFSSINYNNYYTTGTNVLGFINGGDKLTLTDIQNGFGGNANSYTFAPTFVSNTNLHLANNIANWCMLGRSLAISGLTTDYDGDTRNTPPTTGADEAIITVPVVATPSNQTICSGGAITSIVFSGPSTSYTWVRDNTSTVTGIAASGSGNISGSFVNTTATAVTVTFTVSTVINGCTGPNFTATVIINPSPVFSFTGAPNAVTSGPPFNSFSNTNATATYSVPLVTGYTYAWTITNGSITGGAGTNAVSVLWGPLNGSVGVLRLTQVNTITGCGKTDSVLVSLGCSSTPPPYTAATLALPTSVCAGSTYTYSVTPITGYLYKWIATGGTIVGPASGTSVTVTWGIASNTASIKVIDSVSCAPAASPINIIVNAAPTALIAGPVNVCANSVKSYSLGNIVGTIASYSWTITGGTITAGQGTATVTVGWGAAGAGTLIASLTSNLGCIGSTPLFNATISVNPTANFTGTTNVCVGTPYIYTASTTGSTYNWTVVGGTITAQSGNTVTVVWSDVTNASLKLTETFNSTGCSANNTQSITVNPLITLTTTGPQQVCVNSSATYTVTGAVVSNVAVTNGTITGGTSNSATILWTSAGTATITITYLSGSCSYNQTYAVNVNASPTPLVVGANAVCTGTTITYSTAFNTGRTYLWNVTSGGTIVSGQGSNSITVLWNTAGLNSVSVNETISSTGCSTTSTVLNVTVTSTPTSAITGSSNVCSGATNTYSAPSASIYNWTVTGGTISGAANASTVTVIWGAGPAGSVSLTTSNGSCNSTSVLPIIVNTTPTPSITGPSAICSGVASVFSAGFNSNYTYTWTITNGSYTLAGNSNTINVTPNTGATSVIVSLSVALNGTPCTSSTSKTVAVNTTPTLALAGSISVCQGSSQTYTASGAASYSFSVNGGNVTATTANTVTITWGGSNGAIIVYGISAAGCSASIAVAITVNDLPTPAIAGSAQVCANNSSSYTVGSLTGATYAWTATGGTISGSASNSAVLVNWGNAGAGTISVTVTNAAGCSVSKTMNVNINSQPVPVITGSTKVCQNTTQTYSVTAAAGAAYNWSVSGGNVVSGSGTNSISVNWTNAGTGVVGVTQGNGLCSASASSSVTIDAAPAIPVVFRAGNILSTNAVATSYQWFNGSTSISGATSSTYTANTAGSYTVLVTNAAGCSTLSNAVNANVGIKAVSAVKEMLVYPNPTSSLVNIAATLNKSQNVVLNLFDVNGKLVYTYTQTSSEVNFKHAVSLESFSAGVYVVQLVTNDGISQQRIVKE